MTDIIIAIAFGFLGLLLGLAGYKLSSRLHNDKKPYVSIIIRQGINIAYLCAAYFISSLFVAQATYGLLGAAIGIGLSSAFGRRTNENNEE